MVSVGRVEVVIRKAPWTFQDLLAGAVAWVPAVSELASGIFEGADRGRHGDPPVSIGVPRDLLRAVWGKGRWWSRAGGLGVFPVSRFPSPPGAFGWKQLEWSAQPRPAARKENLGRCTPWPADSGQGGQLALCRFALFLAGTCRPPSLIMRDTSSAGPGPPKRCPRKPRT